MKTTKWSNRVLSFVMAVVMVLSMFPAAGTYTHVHAKEAPVDNNARSAYSGICGENLTWVLDADGTLTISGTGKMYGYSGEEAPWDLSCESVRNIIVEDGVTDIGDSAFYECTNLTSVVLPDGIISIGEYAFAGCSSLTSINLPEGIVSIGRDAFQRCRSLESIELPDSLTSLGNQAFASSGLKSIDLPDGITSISLAMFFYCDNLTSVELPANLTSIGGEAFYNCSNLASVVFPATLESIGSSAFGYCATPAEIMFMGDAPAIANDVFSEVAATVYYPAGNITWTEDVMQDYGGTITWVAVEDVHVHEYIAVVTAPTCREEGYTTYTCECGSNYTGDVVPALAEHTSVVLAVKGGVPTCTNPFGDLYYCEDCYAYFYESTDFTGHNIRNDTCTVCGEKLLDWGNQKNAWWYLSSDGTLTICGTGELTGTPWDGYEEQIKTFVIASNVDHQDDWDGESLPDMIYPHLTSIYISNDALGNSSLLYRSSVLQEITVESGHPWQYSVDGILYTDAAMQAIDRYPVGRIDTEFTIPDGIEYIFGHAFYGAKNLEKVHLAESVEAVQFYAFANCTALKEFRFLNGEEYRMNLSPIFTGCTGLRRVWLGDQCGTTCGNMRDLFDGFTTLEHIYILGSDTFLGNEDDEEHPGVPGKTVIHGWLGSSAQAFAEQFGYQFVELTECDVNGHDLAHVEFLAPTCEADGKLEHWHCAICGKNYADEDYFDEIDPLVPALGHDMVTDKGYAATCTETGLSDGEHCTRCDEATVGQNVIPALGHDMVTDKGYDATCTETGLTDGEHCSRCDEATVKQTVLPALGHDIVTVKGYAATCTEAGLSDGEQCIRCNEMTTEQRVIPVISHSFTDYLPEDEATCISNASKKAVCDYGCGATDTVFVDGTLDPEAHAFGEWMTEGSKKHRTCELCGSTESIISTEDGDVEIGAPEQPDLDFDVDQVDPEDDRYVLVEEAVNSDESDSEVLKVFDINLKNSEGVHVQPNGTVKVKLPLDWEKDGNYKVYRVNDDGTLEDMNAYRQGSHLVFETDHFSLYVIVEVPNVLLGDANSDGVVDTVDAMLVLQYATYIIEDDALDLSACDVNGDGSVDTIDAMLVLQYATYIIDEFPVQKVA